jgi:hypothetical protein
MLTKIPVKCQVIHLLQIESNAIAGQIIVLSLRLGSCWSKNILDLWIGRVRQREQVAVKASKFGEDNVPYKIAVKGGRVSD